MKDVELKDWKLQLSQNHPMPENHNNNEANELEDRAQSCIK